jgi:anion-transporting  ArsA/GET3 family ATPase
MPGPAATEPTRVLDALAERKLLVISGKGGVGRTTMAALLGMAVARRGRRALVATTGHDDRLAWMLGHDRLDVEGTEVRPGLSIMRLVPMTCVRQYGALLLRSRRVADAVFGNRVVRRLLAAVPGVDDFAVLGKVWHEAVRAERYDTVVFDGPTTGHLRFALEIPQTIVSAIPKGPLLHEAEQMQRTLEDPAQALSVLVGLPEPWPLTELGELAKVLREKVRIGIGCVMVNAMWDTLVPELARPLPVADPGDAVRTALTRLQEPAAIARRHRAAVAEWLTRDTHAGQDLAVLELPWRFGGIAGMNDMLALLERVDPLHEA